MFELPKLKYISCCGGGFRGVLYTGLLASLEKHSDYEKWLSDIQGVVGTSIGSLFALCLVLGLKSNEINELLIPVVSSFENIAPQLDMTLFISRYGFDDGSHVRLKMQKILLRAGLSGDITLQGLQTYCSRELVCCTTHLRAGKAVLLSAKTHPSLKVIDAVFMSICVPFLFTPFEYHGELYVDGGLTMNTPYYYPEDETLVLEILSSPLSNISNWQDYISSVIACGISCQHEQKPLNSAMHVIPLQLPHFLCNKSPMDRHISQHIVVKTIKAGYAAGMQYMFPKFNSTIEKVLTYVLSYHIRFYSTIEADEY